jgi:hypothetical protein
MATDDSVLRMRPKSTLPTASGRAAVQAEVPETPSSPVAERADPLPRPGDPYKAYANRMPHPQMTLFFVSRDYLPDGFSYASLERVRMVASDKAGGGPPLLVMQFSGSIVTEVIIEGRHLYPLCNAIGLHSMPWVWEHPSPRDFAGDDKPLIRKITFREVKT